MNFHKKVFLLVALRAHQNYERLAYSSFTSFTYVLDDNTDSTYVYDYDQLNSTTMHCILCYCTDDAVCHSFIAIMGDVWSHTC